MPIRYAIVQANRYMVQHSDYLIAYCSGVGNSHKLVKYAQGREKRKLIKVTLLNQVFITSCVIIYNSDLFLLLMYEN